VKSPDATIYIPEIEFSCGNDGKSRIDTIYNHVGNYVFDLEMFATKCDEERKRLILETVSMLRKCLDLDMEWTWVLVDMSGVSEMDPVEGLSVQHEINIPEWADRSV